MSDGITTWTVQLADPDEALTATVDGRDRRAFERDGRQTAGLRDLPFKELLERHPEIYVLWTIHHALTRAGLTVGTFPEFEARVVGHRLDGEQQTLPDPTRTAP